MKKLYTTATALLLAAASFAQTPAITDDIEKTTKAVMERINNGAAVCASVVNPLNRRPLA